MDFAVWMYLLYEILVKFVMLTINIVFILFFGNYIYSLQSQSVFLFIHGCFLLMSILDRTQTAFTCFRTILPFYILFRGV